MFLYFGLQQAVYSKASDPVFSLLFFGGNFLQWCLISDERYSLIRSNNAQW